jgi:hypothetical protein
VTELAEAKWAESPFNGYYVKKNVENNGFVFIRKSCRYAGKKTTNTARM